VRQRTITRRTTCLLALAATTALCGLPLRSAYAEHPPREVWERADEILYALGASAGARIADLGAGGGFYTTRLSDAVGSRGRVYAIDIDPQAVRDLLAKVRDSGLANVDVILGTPTDPRLPFESLDAVLTVNTYHEINDRPRTLQALWQSLKPGGRLVVVDNVPLADAGKQKPQHHQHSIALDTVVRELEKAGFKITRREAQFVNLNHDGHEHKEWLLVAVPPL
jgi:predicted methyltransferase